MLLSPLDENPLHLVAGDVACVDHPSSAVAALTGEVKLTVYCVKLYAKLHQPLYLFWASSHHMLDGLRVTEALTRL